ncbi:ImmA/IrrE family metallo-endopeptidase [Tenacibaculum sp. IMCC1]|nr:hypothetical protein KUL118_15630 [Tenacibaculum sp. KUL118]
MVSSSRSQIKKLAEFIALQYNSKITPLEKIIEDESLDIYYDNYGRNTFDGMTLFHNDSFSIHINKDNGNKINSPRGRFTTAHELGHYFIDSHRIGLTQGLLEPHPSFTNNKQYNKIEREADYFASCLLMPEERFKKDIFNKKFDIQLIDSLKEEYNVSRTACAFRYASIGEHPLFIIFAESGKVKWTHYSDDFPYKYLINDDIVPKNTVIGEYFLNIDTEVFKTEEIWAIDCFKYVKDDNIQQKFYEHCITYKNKALSIIWED